MDWKQQYRLSRLLLAAVVMMQLFLQQGVECQQQKQKPQIYWANDGSQNVQKQQRVPNIWSQSYDNHIDRGWNALPAAPAPASQSYFPQPASPAPSAYAPPPAASAFVPSAPPAPVNYYTSPAPPPVYYTTQAPQPQPSYNVPVNVPAPNPPATPAPHGPINYYYYWPDNVQKGVVLPKPSEVFKPEKELFPDKPWLVQGQKVWIAVLTPLIVVALVVPLVAILFSGFTITTTQRSLGLFEGLSNEIGDFASRYGTVLESEQCIQRIICELGSYTNSFTEKTYILPFLELLVPDTMKDNLAIFQKASISGKSAECAAYKCSTWSHYFQ